MWDLPIAAVSAFAVMFVAELGDKTQLLALGFGARYRLRTVAVGLAIGYAAAGAVAALVGGLLGSALPERPLGLAAGALFLVFAVLTVRGDGDDGDSGGDDGGDDRGDDGGDDGGDDRPVVTVRSVIAAIALTIAIAEMGDKTQLSTAALAARANPVAVWIGATVGEVAAGMIGAVAGQRIGLRLDGRTLRLGSALLFATFGVVLLITAW